MNKRKLGVIVAVIALFIAGLLVFYYTKAKQTYVAKISNYDITLAEYYVYLYGQKNEFENLGGSDIWETDFYGETSNNVAKQQALNSLFRIKFSCDYAKKSGIVLTDEEKKEADHSAQEAYDDLPSDFINKSGITIRNMKKIMEEFGMFNKVFEKIAETYELSPIDFENFYTQYQLQNKKAHAKVKIDHILIRSPGKDGEDHLQVAEDVLALAESGEDFDSLVKEYSDDYSVEDIFVYFEATEQNYPPQVVEVAYQLSEGEISAVIPTEEGYYIIKVEEIIAPQETTTKEQVQNLYITQKKRELYEQEYASWSETAKITLNEILLEEILASEI